MKIINQLMQALAGLWLSKTGLGKNELQILPDS